MAGGDAGRRYPFEETTASRFASILGPPAEPTSNSGDNADDQDDSAAAQKAQPDDTTTTSATTATQAAPKRSSRRTSRSTRRATRNQPAKNGDQPTRAAQTANAVDIGKPSAVHIPAELEPRIRAFQRRHGGTRALSNGKLLIWAITDCHGRGRLDDLVGARNVGGDLFGAWTVTSTPDRNGPTFPFTVYLPAPFYDTFDELVERHGAKSRSQLAALTLTDFLNEHDREGKT